MTLACHRRTLSVTPYGGERGLSKRSGLATEHVRPVSSPGRHVPAIPAEVNSTHLSPSSANLILGVVARAKEPIEGAGGQRFASRLFVSGFSTSKSQIRCPAEPADFELFSGRPLLAFSWHFEAPSLGAQWQQKALTEATCFLTSILPLLSTHTNHVQQSSWPTNKRTSFSSGKVLHESGPQEIGYDNNRRN